MVITDEMRFGFEKLLDRAWSETMRFDRKNSEFDERMNFYGDLRFFVKDKCGLEVLGVITYAHEGAPRVHHLLGKQP